MTREESVEIIGSILAVLALIALFWTVVGGFLYGMVWLSAQVFWLVQLLSSIGTFLLIFSLIPSLIFPSSRELCGKGIIIVTYLWGLSLWMFSTLAVYEIWGLWGLFFGLFLFGVGTVPIAFLAFLVNGAWPVSILILVGAIVIYGVRMLGRWVLYKAEAQNALEAWTDLEQNFSD